MNRCDTCQYAEFEFSEIKLKDECVDCTLGYRHKFESDEDCKRYKKLKGNKMKRIVDIPGEMYDWFDNGFPTEDDYVKLWEEIRQGTTLKEELVAELLDLKAEIDIYEAPIYDQPYCRGLKKADEKIIRADERAKVLKPFIDCEEDLRHLENQMENMYEEWSCFSKLSKLESMGIGIVVEGLQTVGYLLGVIDQMKGGADKDEK